METPQDPSPIEHRLREGLSRLALVLRADDWNRARHVGLTPTQLAILEMLEARAGLTVKEIASHLGVSQPTATDSIAALERKTAAVRRTGEADRRSTIVVATPAGIGMLQASRAIDGETGRAAGTLASDEQEALLVTLVRLITSLQEQQAIPIQRMCASCRYFAPFAHDDQAKPHHCRFVDAAFGQRELRIDCRDHDTADPASRAATWEAYQAG